MSTPGYVRNTRDRIWVTRPILRTRGWTDAAIKRFLPEPNGYMVNPHYRYAGHAMPVWTPETVARVEANEGFREWLERSLERRRTTLTALSLPHTGDLAFLDRLDRVQAAIDAVDVEVMAA